MKLGFVTDSTSDLPQEWIRKYNIEVIPAIVVIGNQSYMDGKGLTREEFYTRLPAMKNPPTTAAPSIGEFGKHYQRLVDKGYDHIISFHPPANYTGLPNIARMAASDFDGRVTVLDTGQLTLGLGFQVLAAAEAAEQGKDLKDVLAAVQSTRERALVMAALDTMEYLRRSGRVNWAAATVGTFLRLRPVIKLHEAKVERVGFTRTFKEGFDRMFDMLAELGKLERLAILHTNAEAHARELLAALNPDLPNVPLVNVTTVIGVHVGPNALGFAAVKA
jgi:DegV family protein with EDD domain